MDLSCKAYDVSRGYIVTVGAGDTPEQCARNAVQTWIENGSLSLLLPHCSSTEEIKVDVHGHGFYVVDIQSELRISDGRKIEGSEA